MAQRAAPAQIDRPAGNRLIFAVLALALGSFGILQSMVIPVLPTLKEGLNTTATGVSWVITAYLVSASVFTPIIGRVGDMIGKRRALVFALAALSVGSLVAALAASLEVMIVARVIQGIGGGVLPLAFGILRDALPPARVAGAVGFATAMATGASGLGVVIGGPIVAHLDFHWLFWIPMVLTAGAAVAAQFVIPDSGVRAGGRINVPAALALSGALVGLLVAVSEGPTWGWGSPQVAGLLGFGLACGVTWVVIETRSKTPLIDIKMMKMRPVWTGNSVALMLGMGLYASSAYVPILVQSPPATAGYGFGSTISGSGLFLLCQTVCMFGVCMLAGRLFRWVGARTVLIAGVAVEACGFGLLAVARSQPWEVAAAMALLGLGGGAMLSSVSAIIVGAVPPEETGVASGMNANFRTIGGSIGVAAVASILNSGATGRAYPPASAYTRSFLFLGAGVLLALLPALMMRPPAEQTEDQGEPALVAADGLVPAVGPGAI